MKRLNDEEAIKRLKEARSTIQPYQYVNEAIDYAIQALEQLASKKEHKVDVTYICDGKKCPECSKLCNHTTDISHAVNFEPVMFIDGKTVLSYEEKMPRYKSIILQEHDAEPRTMKAIIDTETDEIYVCKLKKHLALFLGMTIEEVNVDECKTEGKETEGRA